jgi:hypothetical protein
VLQADLSAITDNEGENFEFDNGTPLQTDFFLSDVKFFRSNGTEIKNAERMENVYSMTAIIPVATLAFTQDNGAFGDGGAVAGGNTWYDDNLKTLDDLFEFMMKYDPENDYSGVGDQTDVNVYIEEN